MLRPRGKEKISIYGTKNIWIITTSWLFLTNVHIDYSTYWEIQPACNVFSMLLLRDCKDGVVWKGLYFPPNPDVGEVHCTTIEYIEQPETIKHNEAHPNGGGEVVDGEDRRRIEEEWPEVSRPTLQSPGVHLRHSYSPHGKLVWAALKPWISRLLHGAKKTFSCPSCSITPPRK